MAITTGNSKVSFEWKLKSEDKMNNFFYYSEISNC